MEKETAHTQRAPRREPARHRLRLTANEAQIDALGHVSNIAYVQWIQDVAWDHSRAIGWDLARYRREGGVFVVRRHEITYARAALLGDVLDAWTWVACWHGPRCVRHTEIVRAADGAIVCRAVTHWVLVDPETGRPRRISGAFARALEALGARNTALPRP